MSSTEVSAVPNRPKLTDYKPIGEIQTIDEALKHPGIVSRFKEAVPKHLSTERMLRVCAMAVFRTPKLAECNMMSLLGAMLSLASLGLEMNNQLGHSYLIPFSKNKKTIGENGQDVWTKETNVEVVIGYRGLIDLARRSGSLVSLHADVVYDGDVFEFEYGTKTHLRHIPMGKRDTPIWAYCHAQLTDGQAFEVMPYNLVLKIRNGSQGYQAALKAKVEAEKETNAGKRASKMKAYDTCPWVAYEHAMACKTMIRQVSKVLPMSVEFLRAVEMDELSETGRMSFDQIMTRPEALEDFSIAEDDPTPDDSGNGGPATPPSTPPSPPQTPPEPTKGAEPSTKAEAPAEQSAQPAKRGRPRKDAPQAEIVAAEQPNETVPESYARNQDLGDWEFISPDGEAIPHDLPIKFANAFAEVIAKSAGNQSIVDGLYETNEFMLKRLQTEFPRIYDSLPVRKTAEPPSAKPAQTAQPEGPKPVEMPDMPKFLDRTAQSQDTKDLF